MNQTAPRNAANSRMIQLIAKGEMPPEGDPLPESEVDPAAELPEEAREQLRRLGYLD